MSPLLLRADHLLHHAADSWARAARLALAGYARRSRPPVDELDDEVAVHAEKLGALSEGAFEIKKALSAAVQSQPNGATLPDEVEQLVTDAEAILEAAVHLTSIVGAAAAAKLIGPEASPERHLVAADVRKLADTIHEVRLRLEQTQKQIHDPSAVIRWRTAEAAGRLGLSVDEARDAVMARWRDS